MASLIFEIDNSIATLTFNRPERYNSVNQELAFAIQSALDVCAQDKNVRTVVITGNGKAFCAGQDLVEVTDPQGPLLQDIVEKHYNPIIKKIRELPKPVIAAVNGVAAGAGANIALACDIVVATFSASFIQAFSKIGLIPDSLGTYTLPRLIGWQRASAIMMLGDKISAEEAEKMGMIYRSVSDEDFNDLVDKLAQKLADMPTKGLALTKEALNASMVNSFEAQAALEVKLQHMAGHTHDYKEGVQAFIEKRKPQFKGE